MKNGYFVYYNSHVSGNLHFQVLVDFSNGTAVHLAAPGNGQSVCCSFLTIPIIHYLGRHHHPLLICVSILTIQTHLREGVYDQCCLQVHVVVDNLKTILFTTHIVGYFDLACI